jgi:hypothetical protein
MPTDHQDAFRTHANYLQALNELNYPSLEFSSENNHQQLIDRLEKASLSRNLLRKKTSRKSSELQQLTVFLNKSWNTEFLISKTIELVEDYEVVALTLSWLTIQSYYTANSMFHALAFVEGHSTPTTHEKTLNLYVSLWKSWADSDIPWALLNTRIGARSTVSDEFMNCPLRNIDFKINPWVTPQGENAWHLLGKTLRSTRQKRLKTCLKDAQDRKRNELVSKFELENKHRAALGKRKKSVKVSSRPRLTYEEKVKVDTDLRHYSAFDFIYRLRMDANYSKEQRFAEGSGSLEAANSYLSSLQKVVDAFCLVHEIRIIHLIGYRSFEQIFASWNTRMGGKNIDVSIQSRMKTYERHFRKA